MKTYASVLFVFCALLSCKKQDTPEKTSPNNLSGSSVTGIGNVAGKILESQYHKKKKTSTPPTPAVGVVVYIKSDANEEQHTNTLPDGTYKFPSLNVGHYVVSTQSADTVHKKHKTQITISKEVNVVSNETSEVDFNIFQ